MKRLIALLITLVFVVVNICPVLASDAEYKICGNKLIVLPAKAGEICTLDYGLYTADLSQKVNAKFSLSGDINGIFISEDGKLFATHEAQVGTITVSALYDGVVYTKDVSVKKGYFEDFESYSNGVMPSTNGWLDSRAGTICSDATGKYLDGSTNSYAVYEFDSNLATEDLTFELDVYVSNDKKSLFQIAAAGNSVESADQYYIDFWFNSTLWLRTKYVEDGSTVSYRNLTQFTPGSWTRLKMQFNLVDNYYSVWAGSQKIIDNWKLNTGFSTYTFKKLIIKGLVDNLKVYSGTPVTASITAPNERVTIPESGKEVKLDLAASLVVGSDAYAGLKPQWQLENPCTGVSVSDNKLVVTDEAAPGTVNLKATFGELTAFKTVELCMPTIRLNLGGENLNISALANSDYEVSIYNPSNSLSLIDKFVSTTDSSQGDADITQNVTTASDGKYTFSLSSLDAGTYNVYVKDVLTGETSQIKYISKLNELLSDSSATADNKFADFLIKEGIDNPQNVKNVYSSVTNRDYVITLTDEDINNFPVACFLAAILEQETANADINTYAKNALQAKELDSDCIDLLCVNADYALAVSAITADNAQTIDDLLESVYKNAILCGVASASDGDGAKVFVENINSDTYNNARPMEKEFILNSVYGKTYASIDALKSDIDSIDLSGVGMDCVVNGPSLVVLPAKSGQMSAVKYTLYDNEIFSDADAKFTLKESAKGLVMLDDGTLLTSMDAKPGKIKIQAKYKNTIFEKELTLKAGYYTDFQSDKVGEVAAGWENRTSYVKKEADGNKYMDGKTDGQNARLSLEDYTSESVTVEFKTLLTEENTTAEAWTGIFSIGSSTAGGKTGQFYFSHSARKLGGVPKVVTYVDKNGNSINDYQVIKNLEYNKWYNSKFIFDYSVPSYSLYINNELVLEDYRLSLGATDYNLTKVIFGGFVDEVNIYSGNCGDLTYHAPTQRVALPLAGSNTDTILKLSLTFDGKTYNNIPANWQLKNTYNGVSINGNVLTVSPDASVGSVVVTTTIAGVTIEKTVELYNPSFRLSVDGSTLKISGQPNADYNVNIYSPETGEDLIDKFMLDTTADDGIATQAQSISANANGAVDLNLSSLDAGKYNIYVEKQDTNEEMHIVYFAKVSQLLGDFQSLESYKFKELLEDLGIANSDEAHSIYLGLSNKSFATEICDDNLYNFPKAVAVAALLEETNSTSETSEFAKKAGIDSAIIEMLCANAIYSEVTAIVKAQNTTTLESTIDAIKTNAILIGIKNVVNKKDTMAFLENVDSTKYANATPAQKVIIAQALAKRTFASLADVKNAINAVDITSAQTGGSAGGGLSGVSTSTGSGGGVGAPPAVTVPQTPAKPLGTYSDVPNDFWAKDAIELLSQKGIIAGYDGKFRPNDTLTRGEMAKIISVAANLKEGTSAFGDVNANDWFYPYVSSAYSAGLVNGYDGNFNPYANVTRQDVAVILYRLFGDKLEISDNITFGDKDDVADYAKNAIATLCSAGIINGYEDGTFKPQNSITRAEIARLMSNCTTLWEGDSNE
ncbi:MAG: S-layer homology domain-containing protein [Clostridia bacterium]|nr:S-layer homology domain-containing protein [Clostridia bacterium]